MYRPLPSYLTIKSSKIDGLGLFATENIKESTSLGFSHVSDRWFSGGYIRTPLGGFFNHSNDPNCKIVEDGRYLLLVTIKDIMPGEEITSIYTLYTPPSTVHRP